MLYERAGSVPSAIFMFRKMGHLLEFTRLTIPKTASLSSIADPNASTGPDLYRQHYTLSSLHHNFCSIYKFVLPFLFSWLKVKGIACTFTATICIQPSNSVL